MPTYNLTFTSWSSVAGSGTRAWTNPGNAQALDGAVASASSVPNNYAHSDYLQGVSPASIPSFAANEVISSITLSVTKETGTTAVDYAVYLMAGGSMLTAINKADTSTQWQNTLSLSTYSFSGPDLATLGVTKASVNSSLGVAFAGSRFDASISCMVDQIAMTINTVLQAVNPQSTVFVPGIGIKSL
jgi:hypothetical protein